MAWTLQRLASRATAAVKEELRNRQLEAEIVAYLERNPSASDSVMGVASWWLGSKIQSASPVDVQVALESLVLDGILKKVEAPGGQVLYSKNKGHQRDNE